MEEKSTSSPRNRKVPASRWWTPATILTSVDLPAPFSPTRAWIEPPSTTSEPDRSASTEPNALATSRSSSTGPAEEGRLVTGGLLEGLKRFNNCVTVRLSDGRHAGQEIW